MVVTYTQQCPVLFGAGAVNQVADKAKALGGTKAFCIYDQGVKMTGTSDRVLKLLNDAGIETVTFDAVLPDAPDYLVNEIGQLARDSKADIIIGIGGGSTLDTAKAVAVLIDNPLPVKNYYVSTGNQFLIKTPLILIATAAGTGSEVTIMSVIHDHENEVKTGLNRPGSLAIVDPELTLTMPPHITAATGMDALAHAIEAYTTFFVNPHSELLSLAAIDLIANNLEKAYQNGSDLEARTNMSFASNIAGISFSETLIHFGHAAAHEFGVRFHMPHGVACAIGLPEVIRFSADVAPERTFKIVKALGVEIPEGATSVEAAELAATKIRTMNKNLGIKSLKEQGISREDAVASAQDTVTKNPFVKFALKPIDATVMAELIGKMYDNYQ